MDPSALVLANTARMAPPLVPEVTLHLATEVVPLWRKTEEELEAAGVPPPYWAFAWAGGQALARYVLDTPSLVCRKHILDFGSGSGLVAIAAAKAGAAHVVAAELDPFAAAAIVLNCDANVASQSVTITTTDIIGSPCAWDVILVGDMCYERPLAERVLAWLERCARDGAEIVLGDPGRNYFPKSGVARLATYNVNVTRELEDREIRETGVYRLVPGAVTGAGPT